MASYIDNGNKLDWALPFQRTGDFPLDRSSMFSSLTDAVKYAAGSSSNPDSRGLQGSSYVGQIITVFENNVVNVYKIEADRSLTLVGAGADDYTELSNKPSINNVTLVGDKTSADLGLASQASVTEINSKIPNQASSTNQLADKDFVNSSISTATATFRGTFTSLSALQATEGDKNDYAFYSHTDAAGNTVYDRYKYVGLPESRVPEGYTQLESVEVGYAGGSGYIDTGIKINSNDNIYLHYYYETNVNANYFFGASDSNSNLIAISKNFNAVPFFKTNLDSLGVPYGGTHELSVTNNIMSVDDSPVGSMRITSVDSNIYIFGYNNNGTYSGQQPPKSRLYEFTIFDSNNDKRIELIPCKRDLDNVVGVYDTVGNTFITPTNGVLKANQISSDKWVYEYSLNNSSFTSAQWASINSGVTSNTVSSVNTIETYIPSQASASNQLADKNFVNSSVSTATATFRGTYTSLQTLQAVEGDKNDYAFYSHTDSAGNTVYDRYKYVGTPASILPEGYTEVDSVNCTGDSGYINTEIIPSATLVIETALNSSNFNGYNYIYFMGSDYYTVHNNQFLRAVRISRGDGGVYRVTTELFENNKKNTLKIDQSEIYVNGTRIGTTNFGNTPVNPLYLFTNIKNDGTFDASEPSTNKNIYRTTFTNNNEVIADMVPCYRDLDNKVGFYDVVRNKFYINDKDANNFTYTPLSTDKWEYEYTLNNSSFTAAQWATINSGLTSQTGTDVTNIKTLIPSQASAVNQLADKDYVDSSISTATATFRGTFTNLQTLQNTSGDRNDYAFYSHTDTAGNTVFDRYKYVGIPEARLPEGYTEVGCIIRNANVKAYINTGLTNENNLTVEMEVKGGSGYNNTFFGHISSYRLMWGYTSPRYLAYAMNGTLGYVVMPTGSQAEKHTIKMGPTDLYVDGEVKASSTYASNGSSLYLGLISETNGDANTNNNPIYIYSFKATRGNTTVMELVPCIRDSDNTVGMYDLISEQFMTSTESAFTYEALSVDRWEYEYTLNNSSFTAAQWTTINSELAAHVTSNGYDATKTQVLKNVTGTLTWVEETTYANGDGESY